MLEDAPRMNPLGKKVIFKREFKDQVILTNEKEMLYGVVESVGPRVEKIAIGDKIHPNPHTYAIVEYDGDEYCIISEDNIYAKNI